MKRFISLFMSVAVTLALLPAAGAVTVKADVVAATVIYSNNFENSADLPSGKTSSDLLSNVNGSTALSYDITFDASSNWSDKINWQNAAFNTEYANSINSGATMQFDILLPKGSTYNGLMKVSAATKMGSGWTWTQNTTIPEVKASDFTATSDGNYLIKTVQIPFGDEITNDTGLHSIILTVAGYQCDYSGKIYIDNLKFTDGVAAASTGSVYVDKTTSPTAQTVVDALKISAPSSVNLVDSSATGKTAALYSYLRGVGASKYVIFGHQNDTTHKVYSGGTNSDTKDMTGSIAGLCAIDGLSLTGAELQLTSPYTDILLNI